MNSERDILQRINTLEIELRHAKEEMNKLDVRTGYEIKALKRQVAYYDKMTLKWGGFVMGVLTLGALIVAGAERVKEKVIGWFL